MFYSGTERIEYFLWMFGQRLPFKTAEKINKSRPNCSKVLCTCLANSKTYLGIDILLQLCIT